MSLGIIYFLLFNLTRDFNQLETLRTDNGTDLFNMNIYLRNDLEQPAHRNKLDSLELVKKIDKTVNERGSLILANPEANFKAIKDSAIGTGYLRKEKNQCLYPEKARGCIRTSRR